MPFRRARSAAAPALLSLLFLLSGCSDGGSALPSAPQSTQDKGAVDPKQAAFFQCLKEQGLPMKDTASGIPVVDSATADPAKVKEAERACESRRSIPQVTTEQLAAAKGFTACMRANGVPDFPDPDPQTAQHDIEKLDLKNSPKGSEALKKCGGEDKSKTAGKVGG